MIQNEKPLVAITKKSKDTLREQYKKYPRTNPGQNERAINLKGTSKDNKNKHIILGYNILFKNKIDENKNKK